MERIDNRGNESVKTRFLDENLTSISTSISTDVKVNCAKFLTEHYIMSTSNDKHIRIWDLRANRLLFKQQVYNSSCADKLSLIN